MVGDGKDRGTICPGVRVDIVQKQDQRTGKKTRGTVKEILTNSTYHPHGIKVRLVDGKIGRVCQILGEETLSGTSL
ncbi:MAG: YwbE family protein [Methanospirillum sp.]|uniref:YwbE family protein n=1 Tax=Methanospirillum sp. TaxID=45200 RepID=UPI00236FEC05|nr:YwbE family protein [Methanospirillum sp.]MDD1728618.1 YwbE family protein [Methanospirillum sp.]